jgi:hypothetical protein
MGGKAPNPKSQIPKKNQATNYKRDLTTDAHGWARIGKERKNELHAL